MRSEPSRKGSQVMVKLVHINLEKKEKDKQQLSAMMRSQPPMKGCQVVVKLVQINVNEIKETSSK